MKTATVKKLTRAEEIPDALRSLADDLLSIIPKVDTMEELYAVLSHEFVRCMEDTRTPHSSMTVVLLAYLRVQARTVSMTPAPLLARMAQELCEWATDKNDVEVGHEGD